MRTFPAVAPVDERDREVGGVLQPQRPVQRRVAAADDHYALARELRLLADDVVQPATFPAVDVFDSELARLERAVPCGDDDRAREVGVPGVRREGENLLAVLAQALERARLLAEHDVGAVLEALLRTEIDELLAENLWVAGHVVDVLLRIRRCDLAADLLE
jgi:hypothetical protein